MEDYAAQAHALASGLDLDDSFLNREALDRFKKAQDASIDLTQVFGSVWGELLKDRARAFPCDPNMLLLPMLGYIASLIGTKAQVHVKGGWDEPLIIWGLIAQPASSLKSPAGGVFGKPLAKLQGEASRQYAKQADTHKLKEKRWKADCKNIEAKAKKDNDSPDLPEPPESPLPPRHYYVESVTIERLAAIHSQPNVHGLLDFHDELADWFASLEKKQQNDRPRWLKLWTGQALKHDTATGVNAFTENTAVSIIGFIQPDKLAALHALEANGEADQSGDGLWSRFLPLIPKTIPFTFNDLAIEITDDLMALAQTLEYIPPNTSLQIALPAIHKVFKPAWEEWSEQEADTSASRAAFIGKLRGYSVRIAGLLHLLHHGAIGDIDMATAQTAINLCQFFLAQFDQLAPQIASTGDVDPITARFLARVKDRSLKQVTVRELQKWKLLGKTANTDDCRAFFSGLAERGTGTFTREHAKGSAKGKWVWRP
ncbi:MULTISPECIES: DUF3987 domain-containing protein [Prochlorococcus]|uniref:DUF3987 domain-containing protein n=1 Tax=Prochlorococcus TaxID=1218 RepID=UPI0007B31EAE|nr:MULTISPECIES: DUF3987 domain-containing protein [Prochlorococcus]KZR67289.1 hypothetical protein PMIT1312_00580 [Prochlorococcus marinus str. MIT 1312]NMO83625.1 DUF3987 domain-containing protein [Prochlorococcus sp. P1344]NMP14313.1 DUF3987 domain-containing protein [Prochlorococcus sp.P1363]